MVASISTLLDWGIKGPGLEAASPTRLEVGEILRPVGLILSIGIKMEADSKPSIRWVKNVFTVLFGVHPSSDGSFGGNGRVTDNEIFAFNISSAGRWFVTSRIPGRTVWTSVGIELN